MRADVVADAHAERGRRRAEFPETRSLSGHRLDTASVIVGRSSFEGPRPLRTIGPERPETRQRPSTKVP